MKYAEMIAERLFYLGEKPTTKPTPIFVGETLREMLERDKKDEEGAIDLYKKVIKKSWDKGDHTTNRLFRQIAARAEHRYVETRRQLAMILTIKSDLVILIFWFYLTMFLLFPNYLYELGIPTIF